MRPLRENERESRWRAFWHGLYWHFPLCCILAYLIRWNASSYNGIYTLHPDRTVKAWKPCWWHDSHPPKGSIRDSNWVGLNTYDRYGVVPEGAWPGEARS